MTWVDRQRIQFDGEPVVLRGPVRMEVRSNVPLPPTAMAEAAAAYQQFRNNLSLSLLEYVVRREILPCGVLMTIRSIQERDVVRLYFSDKLRKKCLIPLESGIVDLIRVLPGPTENDAGILYRTPYVQNYIDTPPGGGKTHLVGPLHVPGLIGRAPPDASVSKAFPEKTLAKKRAAAICPPSLFTGRTRLWIQALYGAHPAMFENYIALEELPGLRPFLRINTIEVNTATGVYLDPETLRHWMISVSSGSVTYYPMVASECGERLRRLLGSTRLSEADKQRVETYILASSVPSPSRAVVGEPTSGTDFPMEAMGYSWHFNYAGTACDIVEVQEVILPEFSLIGGGENVSTHYRIAHARNRLPNGQYQWLFTVSIVEGPTVWKSALSRTAICYPLWALDVLAKAGIFRGAQIPYGNAPFYVFYRKNDVQVCRYITSHSEVPPSRISDPEYFGGNVPLRTPYRGTLGGEGAEWEDTVNKTEDYTQIVIGGTSFDALWSVADLIGEVQSEKPFLPEEESDIDAGFGTFFNGTTHDDIEPKMTAYGDANPAITSTDISDGVDVEINAARQRTFGFLGGFTYSAYTGRDDRTTRTATIIPFYDAEAVFVHKELTTDDTKAIADSVYDGGCGSWFGQDEYYSTNPDGGFARVVRYKFSSGPVGVVPTTVFRSEGAIAVEDDTVLLTSGAGQQDCKMNMGVEIFFNPQEVVVPQQFATLSSVNGSVYVQGKDVKTNVPPQIDEFGPITFVGWA